MGVFLKISDYRKKFNSNLENRELLFQSSVAFVIRIVAAISVFVMNLVIARRLGSSDSGIFFLGYAIITILSTVVRLGGDNLLVRYVGIFGTEEKWKTVKFIVSKVGYVTFFLGATVTLILILIIKPITIYIFHKPDIAGTLFWMLLSMPLFALHTLFAYIFQGVKKVLLSVAVQNILVPISLSILIIVLKPNNPAEVAKLYFVSSVLTVLITLYVWNKIIPAGDANEVPKLPDHFWKSGYALWTFTIFQMAMQWGGQFIAGIYCTQGNLAQLAVAQRTSMLISFILIAINLISSPKFASLYQQGKSENLKRYAINSTRVMVLFSTPIVLVMILFPKFIMSFFGTGFELGAPMLVILSLGQYVNILTGSVAQLLMMSGHEKDMKNIQIFVGIFCTILNFVLIKTNGIIGAAVAISLSVAIQNLIFVGMVKKRLGFNTLAIWKR